MKTTYYNAKIICQNSKLINYKPGLYVPKYPLVYLFIFFFKVIFDKDPAPKGIKKADQHAIMSQAMIRGMVDEDNDQFVAYFLPVRYNYSW